MKDYLTFNITCHFGSAIVNNDYSGLIDGEDEQLNRFLDKLKTDYKTTDLIMEAFDDEPQFTRCDVTNLMSDCIKFTLEISE